MAKVSILIFIQHLSKNFIILLLTLGGLVGFTYLIDCLKKTHPTFFVIVGFLILFSVFCVVLYWIIKDSWDKAKKQAGK
jgi:apolipoprotein N-acyltransferase